MREDAPQTLRAGLLGILSEMGHSYTSMREFICPVLHQFPDLSNWSDIPNVRDEVFCLVQNCDWFRIYDIAEAAYRSFARENREGEFAERLNALFEDLGIGWQMIDGQIVTRGDQEFERVVGQAAVQIEAAGLRTAKAELDEARADLSAAVGRRAVCNESDSARKVCPLSSPASAPGEATAGRLWW